MQKLLICLLLLISTSVLSQSKEETCIIDILNTQAEAWNNGDIEKFMDTYWKSDSLMFIGKSGVVWGWQHTLENYKKGYPDTAAMGKLRFDITQTKKISNDHYWVVGKWMLTRTIGDISGHFTLLIRRINGEWKIVADHSS